MAGERMVFTREFKLGAIRLVTDKGMSVIKAASSLGIREGILRKWKAKWEAEGEEAFPGNGKQNSRDSEVARLMAENHDHKNRQAQGRKNKKRIARRAATV